MKNSVEKILQINAGSIENNNNDVNFGGVETFLLNIYRNIDRNRYVFDFLTPGKTTYSQQIEELKSYCSNVYELRVCQNRFIRLIQFFIRFILFLRIHKYKIVHIHTGSLYLQTVAVLACRFAKTPNVICHSHGAKKYGSLLSKVCKKIVTKLSNYQLSCSKLACHSIFDEKSEEFKNIIILRNGIDVEKFKFSVKAREEYRKELKIENKLVIGHIGNFVEAKNHLFLIDVFKKIAKLNDNTILLLVGDGQLRNKVENKIIQLGLSEKVLLLGHKKDIPELLSTFDAFVFPSIHEGFGISVIEAQASGLKCYISDSISNEVDVTDLVYRISLNTSAQYWANNILNNIKNIDRKSYNKLLLDKGFTLKELGNNIQKLYESILREKE